MVNWDQAEEVEVVGGAFIGWDDKPGQVVAGKVLVHDPVGGTDFNGGKCPLLSIELLDATYSVNKAGQRTDFAAGDLVNITAGQANLKRTIAQASPQRGDLLRLELVGTEKVDKGTVKLFKARVLRGQGETAAPASAPVASAPAAAPAAPASPNGAPPANSGMTQEQWDALEPGMRQAIADMAAK